ncbi:DUF72 domain-containing protein [Alkalihalobacillus pseudalcaliphilus]|uniref:DUF72 domain-containing protein n=1 Tax=Alkalihalobacillus pseudalcaliphilus TaxID=79884 RepID=UPI00064DE390|nr:DUF72 domain-containing protein [Alkalihalobacillus pseudalcaliphilus]KMK77641.1 hypothetical protein AB990_04070 [Alkalihalobacillus pseudalcaliphilus]
MIYIGLAGWGDHDSLYEGLSSTASKLDVYAGHFPIVEVDASFYAVQPLRNMQKWVRETPATFQFIVKAYQGMTLHQKALTPFESRSEMFRAFRDSLKPMIESNKLAMVLCQFPPWFDCKKEHVQYIRYVKQELAHLPVALEFRHQSWFQPQYREQTLAFMQEEDWIHSICDEPQAGSGSIPIVMQATNKSKTLFRFHGRNIHGWNDPGNGRWREVRYLYRYNENELREWTKQLQSFQTESKHLFVIFNNNSGGDAADNAKEMIEMLGIEYENLAPRQLGLF